uniref:Uncharacterized protein n=1 Tax=Anguilla anguilla TaxID=7936 RepID=A0A0E9US10_ANGAN
MHMSYSIFSKIRGIRTIMSGFNVSRNEKNTRFNISMSPISNQSMKAF